MATMYLLSKLSFLRDLTRSSWVKIKHNLSLGEFQCIRVRIIKFE